MQRVLNVSKIIILTNGINHAALPCERFAINSVVKYWQRYNTIATVPNARDAFEF